MIAIENIFVSPLATILEALQIIDRGSVQIALVVDEERRLLGTVTDGDVRRGILRGIGLDAPVAQVMNREPRTARLDMDRDMILSVMQYLNLRQFPVLDEEGRIVRLELIDQLHQRNSRDNWVVLMAGGLGARLGELTKDCPKPLLKVGTKPIMEVILESFISSGFHRFYIAVNYRADMIRDYFGDGSKWGVEIRYLHEGKRLGTAGALSLLPETAGLPVIVMNGDLLTKVNFRQLVDFHVETKSKATMCVREYEFQIPYGVVQVESHKLRGIEEKPLQKFFVNGGIYVIDPELVQLIPQDTFYDMPTLFEEAIKRECNTSVFPIREYWIDIGRKDDFDRANGDYMEVFG
ncbi:CBS domain-containing protein [Paenibacillus lycopersici]|uniref:CBS domain-containing protein n=1 Tax=Paenibacillus lycopersici TaxID=2704462 RepID=A0A6C0G4B3_9BACL|nr:nucleotidyltransferase family protein [Paenibacillus lycopersici]QHT63432.1 CBS domain-containing protein [Paenibacillus lycopersici]